MGDLFEFQARLLAAGAIAAGQGYVALVLSWRLLPRCSWSLRWCSLGLLGVCWAEIGFMLLLHAGLFKLPAALALNGLAAGLAWRYRPPDWTARAALCQLAGGTGRALCPLFRGRWALLAWPLLFAALVLLLRPLFLPVLAWDSLTYHGTKAAMWVQHGGPIPLVDPGAWKVQRGYFGGGEALSAWWMLALRRGTLAPMPGLLTWLLFWPALVELGRLLGVRARHRWVLAGYGLFIPALTLSVGSLYVDSLLTLCVLWGVVFGLRARLRDDTVSLVLALGALAASCIVKFSVLPLAGGLGLLLAAAALRPRAAGPRALLAGIALGLLITGPWLLLNLRQNGYPLGTVPLSIAGIQLGELTSSMRWYQDRPELEPRLIDELGALQSVFSLPWRKHTHLSALSLPFLVVGLFALAGELRRRPRVGWFLLAAAVIPVLSIYLPGFTVVRLMWSEHLGRFLFPTFFVLLCCSFMRDARRFGFILVGLALAGLVLHAATHLFIGWAAFEWLPLLAGAAGCSAWIALRSRVPWALSLLVLWLGLGALERFRESTWEQAMQRSFLMHEVPRTWYPAALHLHRAEAARIAITTGDYQNADNFFIYPFLGARLQHRILYLPLSESGEIVPFSPQGDRERLGHYPSWESRLREEQIDYVLTLRPRSVEAGWMDAHPGRFALIAGRSADWGLYRVVKPGGFEGNSALSTGGQAL